MSPARTVIVGARGFVGGAIVRRLSGAGMAVLPLGRGDINLLQSDAGTTLAAKLRVDDAVVLVSAEAPCRDAAGMVRNMTMARAMCDALARQPVAHVVNISSDAVYPDEPALVSEVTLAAPASAHGAMHRAREILLCLALKTPLAHLRPSVLYGAADPHNGYGPNRFRRTAVNEGKITLFGEGEEKRDHVFIDDMGELVRLVLVKRFSGILNVGTGRSASFREVADLVAAHACRSVAIEGSPRRNPITHRHFDVRTRIRAFPEFRPTPLAEGIALVSQQSARAS